MLPVPTDSSRTGTGHLTFRNRFTMIARHWPLAVREDGNARRLHRLHERRGASIMNISLRVLSLLCAGYLAGCATAPHPAAPPMVGSDVDAHQCKASAGYAWCEREHACIRPWELAWEKSIQIAEEGFGRYCSADPASTP